MNNKKNPNTTENTIQSTKVKSQQMIDKTLHHKTNDWATGTVINSGGFFWWFEIPAPLVASDMILLLKIGWWFMKDEMKTGLWLIKSNETYPLSLAP